MNFICIDKTTSSAQPRIVADINWNYKDAFIGTVSEWPTNVDSDNEDDISEGLIFDTFFAAPLLSTTGLYKERKFSGSDGIGENTDEVGLAIDAYAHHVYVDSHGTMILTDLQGIFIHAPSCSPSYSRTNRGCRSWQICMLI